MKRRIRRYGLCQCGCGLRVKSHGATYRTGHAPSTLTQRLWRNIRVTGPDDCWDWMGQRNRDGYGKIRDKDRFLTTHRAVYELTHGSIPQGMVVRHTCDRSPCCNPAHLLVGTSADNTRDAVERGRTARGLRHARGKLSDDDVREIRRLAADGLQRNEIAARYGIGANYVSMLASGYSRRHVA